MKMNSQNLFISYCWDNKEQMEDLDQVFTWMYPEITIIRDTKDLRCGMNIKQFMNKIRTADYAAIVISDKFLRSKNCMYEVTELIEANNYDEKIIPISIDDLNIFNERNRITYYDYWEEELRNAQTLYNKHHNQDYKKNILLYTKIWYYLDDFFDHIKNIKFFDLRVLEQIGEDHENKDEVVDFFQDLSDKLGLDIDAKERYEIFMEGLSWSLFCFDKKKYKEFYKKYQGNDYAQYIINREKQERRKK